jgi:hypothetical protein
MRKPVLGRGQELRVAGISAILIATVLGSAAAALAGQPSPAPHSVAAVVRLQGVDIVPPTPIDVSFAAPQRPTHAVRPAPVARPTAAPAPVTPAAAAPSSGCADPASRAAAALASLLHPVPAGVTYSVKPGGGALKGMTYYDSHHVDLFVASCGRESDALLRHVVAHETGHAWDSLHMTAQLRADYLAARGIPAGTPWFGCSGCQDFATPAGDFAETYAQWQRGASDNRSELAPPATPAQLGDLGARFFS